jgi:hypothetical protein
MLLQFFLETFGGFTQSAVFDFFFRYNKKENDFESLREYNDYLEEVETISKSLLFFCFVQYIDGVFAKYCLGHSWLLTKLTAIIFQHA